MQRGDGRDGSTGKADEEAGISVDRAILMGLADGEDAHVRVVLLRMVSRGGPSVGS